MNNSLFVAIGDIHGRFDLLSLLLTKISTTVTEDHTLVFLGDMIDRGPQSFEVVDHIKKLTESGKAIAVLGNHDDMMLDYVRQGWVDRQHLWMSNGGRRTIESYGKNVKAYGVSHFFTAVARSGHLPWLKALPLYCETENVWFSHAPVPHRVYRRFDDYRIDKQALIWAFHGEHSVQEEPFVEDIGKLQVVGHVHDLQNRNTFPRIYKHVAYIDTGCGCHPRAPLTAAVVRDGKIERILQADGQELIDNALQRVSD